MESGQIGKVTFVYLSNHGLSIMNRSKNQPGQILRTIGCYLALKLLQFTGLLVPGWGTWSKRLFFILTTYHELQRHQLFANIPLERVNERLLKIKQQAVLTNVSEITQWNVIHLDLNELRERGVDIQAIVSGSQLGARDLEIVTKAIIDSCPASLNYGKSAMYSDVLRLLCPENTCMRIS